MRSKLWLFLLPVIGFFTFCFWVTEQGVHGQLESRFLRENVFPALSRVTHILTDLKFKVRGARPFKNKVVIVEIDSPALETLGRWPWHRDVTAHLIEKTFEAGAKVVGLDIIFSEPDPRVPALLADFMIKKKMGHLLPQYETDGLLEEVIRKHSDHLILGWTTEQSCQPAYEPIDACPVEDPNAIALYPPSYQRFSFGEFDVKNFKPSQTPIVSFFSPIANIPAYNDAAKHVGYLNAFLDSDGYIRRSSLAVFAGGKPYPSLPLEMARVGLGEQLKLSLDESQRVSRIEFAKSKKAIPVSPLGVLQVNFRGPSQYLPHLPALDVMSDSDVIEDPIRQQLNGKSKKEILKDAYVLIGLSALGVFDMRQFPFEANAPGVDGHANILDNLLSGDPLIGGASGPGTVIVLLLMVVGAALFAIAIERLDAVPALLLSIGVLFVLAFVDFKLLFGNNHNWNTIFLYLEISSLFILTLAAKYVLEERNKKFIRGAFAKYVAPAIVDSILKDPSKLSLGGEKRELTILFTDIRGFTTFSEKMDAKSLAAFLNDYLGIMTGIIFKNGGTLDKYIGDAIMAFWGAPLTQNAHAQNACKAAIEMLQALEKNRDRFKSQYGIDVYMGVGINSGVVNVGNMGSEQNFEYTVIGDHVNLASRLEGLTKEYEIPIITTQYTLDLIRNFGEKNFPHRILDRVKVKGRSNAVELIQLLERPLPEEAMKLFEEAKALYHSQKWDEAIQRFTSAKTLFGKTQGGSDGPCELFIERCCQFKITPPAPNWDGSWEMTTK